MDEVINFLKNHWDLVLDVVLVLVSFILVLLKGKIKIKENSSVFAEVLELIPEWIKDAEKTYGSGNGSKKLNDVLNTCFEYISDATGFPIASVKLFYGLRIKSIIEEILSTPKKKED